METYPPQRSRRPPLSSSRCLSAVLAASLTLTPIALAAQSAAAEPNGIALGGHWGASTQSTFTATIDYFKGALLRNTYSELFGKGNGGGASLAYRFSPYFELGFGMNRSTHQGMREGSPVGQTFVSGEATARLMIPRVVPGVVPYLSVSTLAGDVDESSTRNAPWPGTRHLYGRGTFVGGGIRIPVTAAFALDAEAKYGSFLFDRAELVSTSDSSRSSQSFQGANVGNSARLSIGLTWHPWSEPVLELPPSVVTASGELRLADGQPVRIHLDDQTVFTGGVLAVRGDSIRLQVWNDGHPVQRAFKTSCISAIDVRRGQRAVARNVLESAVQGAVLIGAVFGVARLTGVSTFPSSSKDFATAELPGAAAGAAFGFFRDRERWQRATPDTWGTGRTRLGDAGCTRTGSAGR